MLALAAFLLAFFLASVAVGQDAPSTDENKTSNDPAAQTADSGPSSTETVSETAAAAAFDFMGDSSPINIDQLREMQVRFREVAGKAAEATVNVQVGASQGSGVIVTRDGYVLTAAHVIGGANLDATIVLNDGRSLKAKTLGLNRTVDSGLLKITDKGKFPYLNPGESETLKTGQWVMAIGHPGGLETDRGVVYRVGRIIRNLPELITTDCSLVGGDSGGPLVDMEGNVIGIHSRIGPNLSANIHVPVDQYNSHWDDLVAARDWGSGIGGRNPASEPWLGFNCEGNTLKIRSVSENSPFAKAGIQAGDVIEEFNGTRVTTRSRLQAMTGDLEPGAVIKIKYKRGEESFEVELTVASRADAPPEN